MSFKIVHLLHPILYVVSHGDKTTDGLAGTYHKAAVDRVRC